VDTLCGIGLPELIILALLGFVVVGPERSQDVALRAGRFLRTVMRSNWWREFNQVADALRNLPNTLVRMAELEETQAALRRSMEEIEEEINLDIMPTIAPRNAPAGSDVITDPWGIRNAAAGTRITSPPEPTQPETSASDAIDTPSTTDEIPDA
jgi:Sec-independent protein translocase protein TatA